MNSFETYGLTSDDVRHMFSKLELRNVISHFISDIGDKYIDTLSKMDVNAVAKLCQRDANELWKFVTSVKPYVIQYQINEINEKIKKADCIGVDLFECSNININRIAIRNHIKELKILKLSGVFYEELLKLSTEYPLTECTLSRREEKYTEPKNVHSTSVGGARWLNPRNEDSFSCNENIFVVCDGHNGTEVSQFLKDNFHKILKMCSALWLKETAIENAFYIVQHIIKYKCMGAGSTLSALWFIDGDVWWMNVGDSDIYVIEKNSSPIKLNLSHRPNDPTENFLLNKRRAKLNEKISNKCFHYSYVPETNTKVALSACSSIDITRRIGAALGGGITYEPSYGVLPAKNNVKYIIATDGLWDCVEGSFQDCISSSISYDLLDKDKMQKVCYACATTLFKKDDTTYVCIEF